MERMSGYTKQLIVALLSVHLELVTKERGDYNLDALSENTLNQAAWELGNCMETEYNLKKIDYLFLRDEYLPLAVTMLKERKSRVTGAF
jgi:hypothetical protein